MYCTLFLTFLHSFWNHVLFFTRLICICLTKALFLLCLGVKVTFAHKGISLMGKTLLRRVENIENGENGDWKYCRLKRVKTHKKIVKSHNTKPIRTPKQ